MGRKVKHLPTLLGDTPVALWWGCESTWKTSIVRLGEQCGGEGKWEGEGKTPVPIKLCHKIKNNKKKRQLNLLKV